MLINLYMQEDCLGEHIEKPLQEWKQKVWVQICVRFCVFANGFSVSLPFRGFSILLLSNLNFINVLYVCKFLILCMFMLMVGNTGRRRGLQIWVMHLSTSPVMLLLWGSIVTITTERGMWSWTKKFVKSLVLRSRFSFYLEGSLS